MTNNKVLIDALKEIQDKIRRWKQDNGGNNLTAHIDAMAAAALASYADAVPQNKKEIASEYIKDYMKYAEFRRLLGNQSEWTIEKIESISAIQMLEYLNGYRKMISELDDTFYAVAEGCEQWETECNILKRKIKKLEGQVTGKSAGVWVDNSIRKPSEDGFYFVKYSVSGGRELFKNGKWQQGYAGKYITEWLDEGEAGKQPEQQPADPWIPVSNSPKEGGRYWCLVEEINDLGISRFQWNCYYDLQKNEWRDNLKTVKVTHYTNLLPFPRFIQTEVSEEQKGE